MLIVYKIVIIPKQKIVVVSVLSRESWDAEISVLYAFLEKKLRKNFVQLLVYPERTYHNDSIYHTILKL